MKQLNRTLRFRRLSRLLGLRPASKLCNPKLRRPPEVDLKINAELEGEGAPWIERKARHG